MDEQRQFEDEDGLPDEASARSPATSFRKRSRDDEYENEWVGSPSFSPYRLSLPRQLSGSHQEIQYFCTANNGQHGSLPDFAAHQETVEVIDGSHWVRFEGNDDIAFSETG